MVRNVKRFNEAFVREGARLNFVLRSRGAEAAQEFASRTLCQYHTTLADPDHYARNPEYRDSFLGSIAKLELAVEDVPFSAYQHLLEVCFEENDRGEE